MTEGTIHNTKIKNMNGSEVVSVYRAKITLLKLKRATLL